MERSHTILLRQLPSFHSGVIHRVEQPAIWKPIFINRKLLLIAFYLRNGAFSVFPVVHPCSVLEETLVDRPKQGQTG